MQRKLQKGARPHSLQGVSIRSTFLRHRSCNGSFTRNHSRVFLVNLHKQEKEVSFVFTDNGVHIRFKTSSTDQFEGCTRTKLPSTLWLPDVFGVERLSTSFPRKRVLVLQNFRFHAVYELPYGETVKCVRKVEYIFFYKILVEYLTCFDELFVVEYSWYPVFKQ